MYMLQPALAVDGHERVLEGRAVAVVDGVYVRARLDQHGYHGQVPTEGRLRQDGEIGAIANQG